MAEQLTEAHVLEALLRRETLGHASAARSRSLYLVGKAVADRMASIVLLLLCSPLLAIVAVAVWLDSPGPVVFRQCRIGFQGRPFTIYKFRTMFVDAPRYSYKVGIRDDRITRVGRLLRRSGLDELPQLVNVLRGEMSLIGPRPEQPFIVDQYEPWQHLRHRVKPGITGWWQIHHRNDVPLHLGVDYDMYYLEHLSFGMDLRIALRTVSVILAGCLGISLQ